MAWQVPYSRDTWRVPDAIIPGNSTSDNPVEFDIVPAWGADWARIKSIAYATGGLAGDEWGPMVQKAVIAAFDNGAQAFENTITRIRGLSVPAVMALRAGIIQPDQWDDKNPDAQTPVTNGVHYTRICGALPVVSFLLASAIAELSQKANIDPRFFVRPSGSGGVETNKPTPSSATGARPTPRRRGTAGSRARTDSQPAGTSHPSPLPPGGTPPGA